MSWTALALGRHLEQEKGHRVPKSPCHTAPTQGLGHLNRGAPHWVYRQLPRRAAGARPTRADPTPTTCSASPAIREAQPGDSRHKTAHSPGTPAAALGLSRSSSPRHASCHCSLQGPKEEGPASMYMGKGSAGQNSPRDWLCGGLTAAGRNNLETSEMTQVMTAVERGCGCSTCRVIMFYLHTGSLKGLGTLCCCPW